MNKWEILGIERTNDLNEVRKAYARQSKIYHPETHPEEFQQLHEAYKMIVAEIKSDKPVMGMGNPVYYASSGFTPGFNIDATSGTDNAHHINSTSKSGSDGYIESVEAENLLFQVEQEASQKNYSVNRPSELDIFERLLNDELTSDNWDKFILSDFFLENQYEETFISAMALMIEERLEYIARTPDEKISELPVIYMMIAYGCFFDKINNRKIKENVYKKDQLTKLADAFRLDDIFAGLKKLEESPKFLGEKFAFYVYRNILEILEDDDPDKERIKTWLIDAFKQENTTHLLEITHYNPHERYWENAIEHRVLDKITRSFAVFELMSRLAESKRRNIEVFREVLYKVCQLNMDDNAAEEKTILMLSLDELTDTTGWRIQPEIADMAGDTVQPGLTDMAGGTVQPGLTGMTGDTIQPGVTGVPVSKMRAENPTSDFPANQAKKDDKDPYRALAYRLSAIFVIILVIITILFFIM